MLRRDKYAGCYRAVKEKNTAPKWCHSCKKPPNLDLIPNLMVVSVSPRNVILINQSGICYSSRSKGPSPYTIPCPCSTIRPPCLQKTGHNSDKRTSQSLTEGKVKMKKTVHQMPGSCPNIQFVGEKKKNPGSVLPFQVIINQTPTF